jgi:hypothetical protein
MHSVERIFILHGCTQIRALIKADEGKGDQDCVLHCDRPPMQSTPSRLRGGKLFEMPEFRTIWIVSLPSLECRGCQSGGREPFP